MLLPPNHGFDLCNSFHISILHTDSRIPWVLLMKFPSFCTCLSKPCTTQLLSWSQEPKETTLICDSWTSCGCCLCWSGKILFVFACILKGKILKRTWDSGDLLHLCVHALSPPLMCDPLPNESQITPELKFVSGTGKCKA